MTRKDDPTPTQGAEATSSRRRHPRAGVPLLVQYELEPGAPFQVDYARDISKTGVFLLSSHRPPIGAVVRVRITTRDGRHLLEGTATVVRADAGGYAMELDGFDEKAREVLEAVVVRAQDEATKPRVGRRRAR